MAGLGQQLLAEARALVTRLHDQDKLADSLLAQSQTLNERINCMKEYQEDLHDLNELSHHRPRSALVHNLQQENRQIRQLQEENRQLKLALEEHQAALDLIMLRYRQQVLQMVQMNSMQKLAEKSIETSSCSGDDVNKLVEFGHVFGSCLKLGEASALKDQEELARLQAENNTLRQLLKIASPNDGQAMKMFAQFLRTQRSQKSIDGKTNDIMDPLVSVVNLEDDRPSSSEREVRAQFDDGLLNAQLIGTGEFENTNLASGQSSGICSPPEAALAPAHPQESRTRGTTVGQSDGDQLIRDVIHQLEKQCSTTEDPLISQEDTNALPLASTLFANSVSAAEIAIFEKPTSNERVKTSIATSGLYNDASSMWIASAKTREALAQLPRGSDGRICYTMPGIMIEDPISDPAVDALRKYCNEDPTLLSRRTHRSASTQLNIPSLLDLVDTGDFRAAIDLTGKLLKAMGQGHGKAHQPSKNTEESLKIWSLRLHLLIAIGQCNLASTEMEAFGNLDGPDMYYEYYQETYSGRKGSMVPFSMRLLHSELPRFVGLQQESLIRLNRILAVITQIIKNIDTGLNIPLSDKAAYVDLWQRRKRNVLSAFGRCLLSMKDFRLANVIYEDIQNMDDGNDSSISGRVQLTLGDMVMAKREFQKHHDVGDDAKMKAWMAMHNGYLNVFNSNYADGLADFEKAAMHDPRNICALNNAAVCQLYLGRLEDAVGTLQNAVQQNPAVALQEGICTNLCTLYELESARSTEKKVSILKMINAHRGDGFNISCLKLNIT